MTSWLVSAGEEPVNISRHQISTVLVILDNIYILSSYLYILYVTHMKIQRTVCMYMYVYEYTYRRYDL